MNNKMSFTSRDEGKMVAYKLLSKFKKEETFEFYRRVCLCSSHVSESK